MGISALLSSPISDRQPPSMQAQALGQPIATVAACANEAANLAR